MNGPADSDSHAANGHKLRMLIVGAFPDRDIGLHGGILTSCRVLLKSSLPRRAELILVDSSSLTVPPPPFFRRLFRACTRILVVTRHAFFSKPDAALFFASPGASFIEKTLMCGVARLSGIRTMMFPRGAELITQYDGSYLHRQLLRVCFRVPDLMLCQGLVYQEFFTSRIGFSIERCPILANWTATPTLLDIGSSRTPPGKSAPVEILYLGWVAEEKGIYELLECANRLIDREDIPPFKIWIAGAGSALVDARRQVTDGNLTEVVQFLGWIDGELKLERLRNADMLVLPSYIEGMPNALIEAMAAGLPVVATSVGAVADVVSQGVTGLIVPPKDAGRLFDALVTLLEDADLRARMGQAGRHIAAEKFGTERAVDCLLRLAGGDAFADTCEHAGNPPQ